MPVITSGYQPDIIRDIWEKNTTDYENETSNNSTQDDPLYLSLDGNDLTYIQCNDVESTTDRFYFRLEPHNIIPNMLEIEARCTPDLDGIDLNLNANGVDMGTIEGFTGASTTTQSIQFHLSEDQRRALIDHRVYGEYDYWSFKFEPSGSLPSGGATSQLHDITINYLSSGFSPSETQINYDTISGAELVKIYPSGLSQTNQIMDSYDYKKIDHPPSGVNSNDEYVEVESNGGLVNNIPSGNITLHFNIHQTPDNDLGYISGVVDASTPLTPVPSDIGHRDFLLMLTAGNTVTPEVDDGFINMAQPTDGTSLFGSIDYKYGEVGEGTIAWDSSGEAMFVNFGGGEIGSVSINEGSNTALSVDSETDGALHVIGVFTAGPTNSSSPPAGYTTAHDHEYLNNGGFDDCHGGVYYKVLGDSGATGNQIIPYDGSEVAAYSFIIEKPKRYYNRTVNRAMLNVGLSHPLALNPGNENYGDHFTVEGYNPNVASGDVNILWGTGDKVESTGWGVFVSELSWLDPKQINDPDTSGNCSSDLHKHAAAFENLELKLRGLPSGVRLSSAELQLEMIEANYAPLYTRGDCEPCDLESSGIAGQSEYNIVVGNWGYGISSGSRNLGDITFQDDIGTQIFEGENSSSGVYMAGSGVIMTPDLRHKYYNGPDSGQEWSTSAVLMSNFGVGTKNEFMYLHTSGNNSPVYTQDEFTLLFSIEPSGPNGSFPSDRILFYHGSDTVPSMVIFNDGTNIIMDEWDITGAGSRMQIDDQYHRIIGYTRTDSNLRYLWGANFHGGTETDVGGMSNAIRNPAGSYTTIGGVPDTNTTSYATANGNWHGYVSNIIMNDRNMIPTHPTDNDFDDEVIPAFYNNYEYVDSNDDVSSDSTYIEWDLHIADENASSLSVFTMSDPDTGPMIHIDGWAAVAYDTIEVAPSAVALRVGFEHESNHPSGLFLDSDLTFFKSGGEVATFNYNYNVPSGAALQEVTLYPNNYVNKQLFSDDYDTIILTHNYSYDHYSSGTYYGNFKLYSTTIEYDAFCQGTPTSGDIFLYTSGSPLITGDMPLFLFNNNESDNIDLYTTAHGINSGDITLFIGTTEPQEEMNLFIEGLDPPNESGNLGLYTWSTTNSGVFGKNTLYINSDLDPDNKLNLYITTPPWSSGESMPLFMGANTTTTNSMDMFLYNERSGVDKSMNLHMKSNVTTSGESMNLYIERNLEGVHHNFPLYVAVQSGSSDQINLVVNGIFKEDNNIPLFTDAIGTNNDNIETYIHGF